MEDRKKSPTEIAAYEAGIELIRKMEAKQEVVPKAPETVYLLPNPNNGYQTTRASLN